MQQKLQIVVTIIHNPDFVILDEPFIGLDPISVEALRNIIDEFKKKEKSILLSTHWMDQAEKLCDEICLISEGKKILSGNLDAIKKEYRKNELLLELKGEGEFISNIDMVEKVKKYNGKLQVELKKESNYKEFLKILLENAELIGFEFLQPSLEEIFIEKVKQNEENLDYT
jgi:ABC-2 type transport system ATP-binding protein